MMKSIILPIAFILLTILPASARDSDDDGIPNKFDECPKTPEDKDGHLDNDGCPDPDNDGDGICDPHWDAAKNKDPKFAGVCKGSDKCIDVPEDKDGFEDEDGCPDPDNDKDGIPDNKDKCPNEPEDFDGFEDSDGCPDPDNDKDGILDAADKCPNVAEDKDGIQDDDGCPETDGDGDGIRDEVDKCPKEPETVNGVEDDDGCPDKAAPPLQPVQSYPLIKFRTGTSEMILEAHQSLDLFAKQLTEYPEKQVEVRVFSWFKGKKEDYLQLMSERSKTLVDYLIGKGVKPEQLKEVEYTLETFDANKGTEADFNQEKPVEFRLLN